MKKLLIIALLFVGCEGFGVFKHEHDEHSIHFTCYKHWRAYTLSSEVIIDTAWHHASSTGDAIDECSINQYLDETFAYPPFDSIWCECEEGILY